MISYGLKCKKYPPVLYYFFPDKKVPKVQLFIEKYLVKKIIISTAEQNTPYLFPYFKNFYLSVSRKKVWQGHSPLCLPCIHSPDGSLHGDCSVCARDSSRSCHGSLPILQYHTCGNGLSVLLYYWRNQGCDYYWCFSGEILFVYLPETPCAVK